MAKRNNYSSTVDAGYGLIYRLNDLWNGADRAALSGNLEKWDHILNAIFRNLCYRNTMDIEYEDLMKTKIKRIGLLEEDALVYNKFEDMLITIKNDKFHAVREKNRTKHTIAINKLHRLLAQKDIWLRKFMQERGLYLREVEFDPSQAMWGG